MFPAAASGGGSSHPVHTKPVSLFGYESMDALYRNAMAFLETIDSSDRKDLEARLIGLVHSGGSLNPKIVGVFFQTVCEEAVRTQSPDVYDDLRENLNKLFYLMPQIEKSFGSDADDSMMSVRVTNTDGKSETLKIPTRMVVNSSIMHDFMERHAGGGGGAAGGAGAGETTWTFQLPPFCSFESFHDYLSFYETGILPKESLEKSCQLLKLAEYLVDNKACTLIVEHFEPALQKSATLADLKTIIDTLEYSTVATKLINISLICLIQEAIDKKQLDRLFAELAGSELKEILASLSLSLSLSGDNITDEVIKQLTIAFPEMRGLSLTNSWGITNEGLAHLRYLTSLTSLDLSRCYRITNEGLAHLSALTSLTSLALNWCPITDEGLPHLRYLTSLTSLALSGCRQIKGAGLAHLAALTSLTNLDLSNCDQIKDAGLAHLAALTSLTNLDLSRCSEITDAGLAHLAALTSLTALYLFGCQKITNAGLAHLRVLTSLTSLDLSLCWGITNEGLAYLAALTSLTSLYLKACWKITDYGLLLLETLLFLKNLNLMGCIRTSPEGRARLVEKGIEISFE